jgi:hypothetical protein
MFCMAGIVQNGVRLANHEEPDEPMGFRRRVRLTLGITDVAATADGRVFGLPRNRARQRAWCLPARSPLKDAGYSLPMCYLRCKNLRTRL